MTNTSRPNLNGRAAFYRFCRDWHGYLSAFAFLALMFFSLTGILLNHPEWFANAERGSETRSVMLSGDALQGAERAEDQAAALAAAVSKVANLRGVFASGEIIESEAMLRFEGVTGNSDVFIDLVSGAAEITVERADAASILNDLHRGKNAGAVWKALIDIVGGLVTALSLVGFVLFFSLRFRLRTSLLLVAASIAAMAVLFVAFVP